MEMTGLRHAQTGCLPGDRNGSKAVGVMAKAIIYPLLMYVMDTIFVKNKK